MELFVLGTSQSVASAHLRERLHVDLDEVYAAVEDLLERGVLQEAVPLATCGRLELYCVAERPHRALGVLRRLMRAHAKVPGEELESFTYAHHGEDAVRHLLRVSAGLDSVVHGEVQILGQVRGALHHPETEVTAGPLLHRLFQRALSAGKRVRTETEIGRGAASLASAALSMLQREVGSLEDVTALVLGAGDTGALMARLLVKNGVGRLVVANRTVEKGRELVAEIGGEAVGLDRVPELLGDCHLVVGAVTATERVLGPDDLPREGARPGFFLDLAHPRNFDPGLAAVEGVRVFDLDHVFERVEAAREERARQVPHAEAIVEEETGSFLQWLRTRENVDVLRAVRSQVLEVAQAVAERHGQGRTEAEREEMRMLARSLARTLLHPPTLALRDADPQSDEGRWLLESATTLFGVSGGQAFGNGRPTGDVGEAADPS